MLYYQRINRTYNITIEFKKYNIRYRVKLNSFENIDITGELAGWINLDSWSLTEAAYLSCDLLPPEKKRIFVRGGVTRKKNSVLKKPLAEAQRIALKKIKDHIRRAKAVNNLKDPTQPKEFIKWLVKLRPNSVICKIELRKLNFPFTEFDADNHSEDLTPQQRSAETNKINTVYKILISLAIKFTNYDHAQSRSSAKSIEEIIKETGLSVSRSIITGHLSTAWENNSDKINDRRRLLREKIKPKKL